MFEKKVILNPSIINTGMKVEGDVSFDGELNVDGVINGDVEAQAIIIGVNGKINGKVKARDVQVYGVVEGAIFADTVFLSSTARVVGNIMHKVLETEFGAYVEGDLRKKS